MLATVIVDLASDLAADHLQFFVVRRLRERSKMRIKWTGNNVKEVDELLQRIPEGTDGVSFILGDQVHVSGSTGIQIAKVGDSIMVPPQGDPVVQHDRPEDSLRADAERLLSIIFDLTASDGNVSRAKTTLVEIVCPEVLRPEGIAWADLATELPPLTEAAANAPRSAAYTDQ